MLGQGALENRIELGGPESLPIPFDDLIDALKNLFHAAAGLRGDEFHRSVREKFQFEPDLLFEFLVVVGFVLCGIPFVDQKHRRLPRLLGIPRHRRILRCNTLGGIEHHQRDLAPLDRLARRDHCQLLRLVARLSLPPDARGVDDHVAPSIVLDLGIDRVACRARNRRDHGALLVEQAIQQR